MARSDLGGRGTVNGYVREKFSSMTDSPRAKLGAAPIVHVYIAKFPFSVDSEKVVPRAREIEIESCSNLKVRQQKYYVWKLLESALMRSFGLKTGEINITKLDSGKWVCDECHFSLSHSDDFVVVAVSQKPVGVDIERCDESRFTDALSEKVASSREREELRRGGGHEKLAALWTRKEAIFKQSGGNCFQPKDIETSQYSTVTKTVRGESGKYFVTVASEDARFAVFRSTDCEVTD